MPKQPISNRKTYEKNYSKEFKNFLNRVIDQADEDNMFDITPDYVILYALTDKDSLLYKTINEVKNVDCNAIYDELYESIMLPTKQKTSLNKEMTPVFSNETNVLFKKADDERKKLKNKFITSDHFLSAYLKSGSGVAFEIFSKYGITYDNFNIALEIVHNLTETLGQIGKNSKKDSGFTPIVFGCDFGEDREIKNGNSIIEVISNITGSNIGGPKYIMGNKNDIEYCTNLNKLAKENGIDNLVGREKEIIDIIRTLNRKKNNNVLLVGDSGVGKTAIVEGLAKKIVNNEVPSAMNNKVIWRLSFSSLTAGTTLRGMLEERVKNILEKFRRFKNCILFIDDLENASKGSKNGDDDSPISLFSEFLSDPNVQIIVTTTYGGYRNVFEGNSNFSNRFQKIIIEKPTKQECLEIINKSIPLYETFHSVKYDVSVPELCISLADRYITEVSLPTSAIGLLDDVGSYKHLKLDVFSKLNKNRGEKNLLLEQKDTLIKADKIEESQEIDEKISLLDKESAKILSDGSDNGRPLIIAEDVYKILSEKTGIPVKKLNISDKDCLKNIEDTLKKDVIGQDEAINIIGRAIKRNKVGLSAPNKPILTCMCIGKSGCGKTLLAKKIAENIFGDEKYLVRFDMSEYSDRGSTIKLIGSSVGYVNHKDGGALTEAIKNRKYAVLLFDEIEKANEEVYNLLLQVLDEGCLTDGMGKKVDFKNTIIILTSNVGTKQATNSHAFGFNGEEGSTYKAVVEKELKNKFPPEFINRLDEIVYFNTLTNENLRTIIKLEIEKLRKRLEYNKQDLQYTDDVVEYILNIVSKEKDYGARPIIRAIQREFENRLIDLLMENDYSEYTFNFKVENEQIVVF